MTKNKEKTLEDKMLDKMTDSERITYLHNKLERNLEIIFSKLGVLDVDICNNKIQIENNLKTIKEIIKNLNTLLPTPEKWEAEKNKELIDWNRDFKLKGLDVRLKKIENIIKKGGQK